VPLVRARLADTPVRCCAVVGFPHGAMATAAKAAEARLAVADGATELDMVLALGAARAGAWDAVRDDVAAVVHAAGGAGVKVIVEAALWTPLELVLACLAAEEAGAAFVKTSTGFHASGGAREADVRLMRRAVGDRLGVKASGGIRTVEAACAMLAAGATRLGTSGSAAILAALPS
jgi:deoxyribose-phosphate aldolase